MHINEIILDQFKSFGQKTRIPLYEDFTTISGPNGSGKSNIIDAVLFALGLARTRGMRAQRLPDLIYNPGYDDGDNSGGAREASVTVVLDNTDRTLDRSQVINAAGSEKIGDVDEITIRRRIKETEANYYSYYYLNDRSVNLSDIRELLAGAGVTPEGYNVVMQGDVTEIINMTPTERREIIDEIAGVAEFDAKKADAFEELETVNERIDKAETRIEEKRDRLTQLEDEREAALEYQSLREEKAEYEGYLKAAELADKREQQADLEDDIEQLNAERADRQAILDKRRGEVTRLEEDLEDLNAEIEHKGEDEQLELQREIETIKGEIERYNDRIDAAEKRIEEAQAKRREAFVEHDHKKEELDDIEATIRETKLEQSSIKAQIKDQKVELADVQAEIEAVDAEYDQLKKRLQELRADRETAKDRRNELQREQDRLLDAARRRSDELETAQDRIETLRARQEELATRRSELERELEKAQRNKENIVSVVEDLTAQKRAKTDALDDLDAELEAKQQEYAELEAKAEREGSQSYGRAVTTVLDADIEGVHGTIGQLGAVADKFATACETAGGGRLANIVVDDDSVGQRCIEQLKQRNAGRATFLPLTEMETRGLPTPPNDPGVIGFAYNLVEFDKQYAGVFSYVLGSTLVVEDIETARQYMGQYRLVTLAGELIEKSGAMTGGSTSGSRYSFSKTGGGKLERVAAEITELQDRRSELKTDLRELEDRLENARNRRSEAADAVRSIEADLDELDKQEADLETELEETKATMTELKEKRESVNETMEEIEADIEEATTTIEELDAEIDEVEAELADSELPALTDKADAIRDEIETLQDRQDELEATLNEQQLEKQYIEETIEDLNADIEAAQNTVAEQRDQIESYETEIEERNEQLEAKRAAVEELETELTELKAERDTLREKLQAAKQKQDAAKAALRDIEDTLTDKRDDLDQLSWEIDQLAEEVGDYDPDTIPSHDEVTTAIEEFEAEMEALEPVNMLAIEEYDEVADELATLEERNEELIAERDAINDRIQSFEQQKRETFMAAYEAIDEQFQAIFKQLSDGSGELVLESPDEPFEGGLTMRAQPADKPIQRLDAMSGGEKSLTALSFIFAIQRYNPAPFYALDEIDAFLDAANAERVGEMVDDLAGDAQFIVVSHRSAMLDRSEHAIGVTMQEDNVSTVTGIDLTEGIA